MTNDIIINRGVGIISIQVWTDALPSRPFPAYTVLVDIKDDGTILHYAGDREHRKQVIEALANKEILVRY